MFCPLHRVELKVNTCPIRCVYKGNNHECAHAVLADKALDSIKIAEIKGEKHYKVKAQIATAKANIAIGLTIHRYAEYVKDSHPERRATENAVNDDEVERKDKASRVLFRVYGLSGYQQQKFWNDSRYVEWAKRNKVAMSLNEVKQTLVSVNPAY